jgi:signal transduction histidine kinase
MRDKPIRVLLVESDADDHARIRQLFEQLSRADYSLDCVASYYDAIDALTRCEHDLYLVDYPLDAKTGLDLVRQARADGCVAPIILLSGSHDRDADSLASKSGADDFLLKDGLNSATLDRAMRYALARKRLQAEICQANLQLQQRVKERTSELNSRNEALQSEIAERKRTEQALREADRRKDEFLATLAHELRNPLAPLTSAIQLIASEPQRPDQVQQLASMMSQQLDQLVRLIDDLADVSRINSGKLRLRSEPADLADVVAAAVEQSQPLIDASRHTLKVDLPEQPLIIQGDKVRLAQIISNLLINAAKYTPPGGKIDLTVSRRESEMLIAVRDTGIGIAPEMLTRIFDLFAQVDSSTTRSHGGLGIGLTIVKTLVEMHGGKIGVSSPGPGRGSEFTVRLPLAAPSTASPQKSSDGNGDQPLPEMQILLVDDNQSAAHMMCRLLEKLGQKVHVADSGPAALLQLPKIAPDIIISDVAMPGMSGYDLARQIRELNLPQRPYLVAVTGYGQESDRQDALAAGFDKHLTKPVGVAALEELLRSREGSH